MTTHTPNKVPTQSHPVADFAANLVESRLDPSDAVYDFEIPAGEPWLHELRAGQTLRILDLMGNQAVDTLFYSAR